MDKTAKEIELRELLLEHLPCVAMVLKKATREIVYANAAARLLGALPGMKCHEACAGSSEPCPFCLASETWIANTPRQVEAEYRGKWYEARWVPLDNDLYLHYIFDITGRKKTEEERALAHTRYQRLANSNMFGLLIADAQGGVREANDYYLDVLGFTRQEFDEGSVNWRTSTPLEWLPADERAIAELRKNGVCTPYEKEYIRKDGSQVRVMLYDTLLPGSGELILAVALNISDRKEAEAALRDSEKRYRSLVENMLNGVAVCQMIFENGRADDFRYLAVNSSFGRLTGLKNVVNRKVSEVIPGFRETDRDLLEAYGRVARSGVPEKIELYVRSLEMWFAISVYGIGGDQFIAVFDVITEQKKMLAALQESEERYRQLVQSANSAIIRWRQDGVITFANAYTHTFFGYEKDELIGKNVRILVPETGSSGVDLRPLVGSILAHPEHYITSVNENVCRDGRKVWFSWTNKPMVDDKGVIVEILAIGSDITGQKMIEKEMSDHVRELEIFYKANIGREERILELKQEIALLKNGLQK